MPAAACTCASTTTGSALTWTRSARASAWSGSRSGSGRYGGTSPSIRGREPAPPSRSTSRCRRGRKARMRVLLADDHGIVRRGMSSLLETEPGVEMVAEAADGAECLRLCETLEPDVAILDI